MERRSVLAGAAAYAAGLLPTGSTQLGLNSPPSPPAAPSPMPKVRPQAKGSAYEILTVGPGQQHPHFTTAMGVAWNRWKNPNTGAALTGGLAAYTGPVPHILIAPGPDGYYSGDSGNYSGNPSIGGAWPPWNGQVMGPMIISGMPGMEPPVIDCAPYGLYYQNGWVNFELEGGCYLPGVTTNDGAGGSLPVSIYVRGITLKNFANHNGGVWRGLFLKPNRSGPADMTVLVEDCTITGCNDGFQGGFPGQKAVFRRNHFFKNGSTDPSITFGSTHDLYAGECDLVVVEDCLHEKPAEAGHLLKSRALVTRLRGVRLYGLSDGGGSGVLDVPAGGELDMDDCVFAQGDLADAGWTVHYGGDDHDGPGRAVNRVIVGPKGIKVFGPTKLAKHSSWAVTGFADCTGPQDPKGQPNPATVTVNGPVVSNYPPGLYATRKGPNSGFPSSTVAPFPASFDTASPVRRLTPLTLP